MIDTQRGLMISSIVKPHSDGLGLAALGGAMTYEKPDIRDFGSIAEHTYFDGGIGDDCFQCASGPGLIDVPVGRL